MRIIAERKHSLWANTLQRRALSGIILVHALVAFSLLSFQTTADEKPDLVLNAAGQPPLNNPAHDGFMDGVSREALSRIGYRLVIDRLPAERALRSANNGSIDGEMGRIKGLEKLYPNLIRVPEKIMDWEFLAFSKTKINLQKGWESLADKNVAFITGWKILEKNVPKKAHITKLRDSTLLFELLEKDRTDIVIYERWGGNQIIDELQLEYISPQVPELAKREMFIYLHKKHLALVPKLAQALAEMKKDGSYKRLVRKHLISLQKETKK